MRIKIISSSWNLKGARVLVRGDFDVALRGRRVQDDYRLRALVPTLDFLLKNRVRLRLLGHLGRPGGKRTGNLSLYPVARYLGSMLGRKIIFIRDPLSRGDLRKYGESADILFFENLRFWKGEEENSPEFAAKLALWGDIYVNDAFANSHRMHASVVRLAGELPAFAGLHLCKEIDSFRRLIKDPRHPAVAVLGGAKLETKLPLISNLLKAGYEILAGGALVNTIFYARGTVLGRSPVDENLVPSLRKLIKNPHLHVPVDLWVASALGSHPHISGINNVGRKELNYDVGPESLKLFIPYIKRARTIIWNGPLGFAEKIEYSGGTRVLARVIAKSRAFSVVGGGDTVAVLHKYRLLRGFSHVSTGGGAMLEFLAGKKLPGIEALKN